MFIPDMNNINININEYKNLINEMAALLENTTDYTFFNDIN